MATSLAAIRYMLLDMDGVLYRGATALPGASDLIAFLDEHAIGYLLVTNNSTLSQAQFSQRLARMGIVVPEERIITSAVATAAYLSALAPVGAKVNVIGEEGLLGEIRKRGFVLAGREAEYVVVGWDKTISFDKLKTACLAIRDGATFIGTNPDKTYPMEQDIIPGAGASLRRWLRPPMYRPRRGQAGADHHRAVSVYLGGQGRGNCLPGGSPGYRYPRWAPGRHDHHPGANGHLHPRGCPAFAGAAGLRLSGSATPVGAVARRSIIRRATHGQPSR